MACRPKKTGFDIDADFVWAAVGGDRLDIPILTVDVDLIYAHGMAGFKVAPEFFVTGGVRRFALDYDIRIGDQAPFSRKPGLWDPLIGVGWHRIGEKFEWHAAVEGGGFGVGADVDFGAGLRFDWKPAAHFGITGGYNFLYFKATEHAGWQGLHLHADLAWPGPRNRLLFLTSPRSRLSAK